MADYMKVIYLVINLILLDSPLASFFDLMLAIVVFTAGFKLFSHIFFTTQAVFEEQLILVPESPPTELPSPEALRNKILIKCHKPVGTTFSKVSDKYSSYLHVRVIWFSSMCLSYAYACISSSFI